MDLDHSLAPDPGAGTQQRRFARYTSTACRTRARLFQQGAPLRDPATGQRFTPEAFYATLDREEAQVRASRERAVQAQTRRLAQLRARTMQPATHPRPRAPRRAPRRHTTTRTAGDDGGGEEAPGSEDAPAPRRGRSAARTLTTSGGAR